MRYLWAAALALSGCAHAQPSLSQDDVDRRISQLAGPDHDPAHEALLRMGAAVKPRLEQAFKDTKDAQQALRISQVLRAIDHVQAQQALREKIGSALKEEGSILYLLTSVRAQDVARGLEQFCGLVVYTHQFERRGEGRLARETPNVDVAEMVRLLLPRVGDELAWQPVKFTLMWLIAERQLADMYPVVEAFLSDPADPVKIYALLTVEAVELDSARPRVKELEKDGSDAVRPIAKRVASKLR